MGNYDYNWSNNRSDIYISNIDEILTKLRRIRIKEPKDKIETNNNGNIINKEIKPRGLNNIGSTCYMNSVLQCFYHVYDLSNELLNYGLKNIFTKAIISKMPMTRALLDVIFELSFGENKSMSPYIFKEIISKNESFRKWEANDSKTLALYVLDTLNRELNENKIKTQNINLVCKIRTYKGKETESIVTQFNRGYNTLIGDLFHGLKMTDYICLSCNNSVKVYQMFNIINCSVEKTFINKYGINQIKKVNQLKISILDCLKEDTKPNFFKGNNKLYCEKCDKSVDGKSNNKICISPKILILFLDRGINNRFMCDVNFAEVIDINEFLEIKGKKYNLIGVIERLGPSGQNGHFIANCKHFDGNWYIFSDSTIKTTQKVYKKYGIPYLLFYRRED